MHGWHYQPNRFCAQIRLILHCVKTGFHGISVRQLTELIGFKDKTEKNRQDKTILFLSPVTTEHDSVFITVRSTQVAFAAKPKIPNPNEEYIRYHRLMNETSSTAREFLSKAQVIAWCFPFSSTVLAVVGKLLTIALFAFKKKFGTKKSLYLVMNVAFADLSFAGVCFSVRIFSLVAHKQCFHFEDLLRFFELFILRLPTSQASFITVVLMAAERFNAIYWPLKHRTISMPTWLVILTTWTLAFLLTVFLLYLTNSRPLAQNAFICLYGLFLVVTICSLNISIWKKFQQKSVPHYHQNRALQNQRLTKALFLVSVFTLSSWIPACSGY